VILGRAAGSTYVGPGDLIATTYFWGGLRAYSNATAAALANAIQVRRASDNTTQDIKVLSTGALDVASALSFAGVDATGTGAISLTTLTFTGGHVGDTVTGGTVAAGTYIVSGSSPTWTVNISQTVASATLTLTWGLFVSKLYNQVGTTNIGDAVQATSATQPALMLNGGGTSGTLPWMRFNGAQRLVAPSGTASPAQPATVSWVGIRTAAFTSYQFVCEGSGATIATGFDTTANKLAQYAGSALPTSGPAPDNAWYAVQSSFNGASSVNYFNGTSVTTSPGTAGLSTPMGIGDAPGGGFPVNGGINEVGLWGSQFSGANDIAVEANQRSAANGWNF
jgi:hypothetical protein